MTASDRDRRAEAARQTILNSGNPDLINRLHLLDAAAGQAQAQSGPQPAERSGATPWGTAMAAGAGAGMGVLGGMMLGTVLGGLALDEQMRAPFATLAEEAGFDPGMIEASLADTASTGDNPGDMGDAGDDDWLGGLFDI
ncbi:MAG: hypothetical protein JJU19_11605 [Pararhodobacter sp.]|nr:hypothetical protein [Pararhodobacter sp.]